MSGLKVALLGNPRDVEGVFDQTASDVASSLGTKGHTVIIPSNLHDERGEALYDVEGLPEKSVVSVQADNVPHSHPELSVFNSVKESKIVNDKAAVKKSLENISDVAVLLPGGGVDALSQAIHMARRGEPLIVVNQAGYYDGLEEEISTIQKHNQDHDLNAKDWEHVTFVEGPDIAGFLVDMHEDHGVSQIEKKERRSLENNDHIHVKKDLGDNIAEYHVHHKTTAHSVGILLHESGLEGLDRLLTEMADNQFSRVVVENTDGYHDGLIKQFDRMVEDGPDDFEDIYGKVDVSVNREQSFVMADEILEPVQKLQVAKLEHDS